jgi:aminopeptidase
VIQPDFENIATLIVERGRLREGEMAVIYAHDEGLALADAVILECYRRGAVPVTLVRREEAEIDVLRRIPEADVARPAEHQVAMMAKTDILIALYCQYKDPAAIADVPQAKIGAYMKGRDPLQDVLYDGNRRILVTDFPTRAQADFFGVPFEKYHDAFWGAMQVDYDELARRVAAVAAVLEGREEVHVTSEKGTDVRLRIGGRRVFADDGVIGMPDEEGRDPLLNLPSGEVCLAPWEDGAEGKVVFDFAFVGGRRVADLEVKFEGGRAELVSAAEGFERAVEFFAAGTGDPYVMAELGIGANAALTEPCGSILLDEKITGTVHLALGDNRTMEGKNQSSIHQDMIILEPRVTCDGELLMADGELKI